jgi:hypothetical protein
MHYAGDIANLGRHYAGNDDRQCVVDQLRKSGNVGGIVVSERSVTWCDGKLG